MNQEQQILKALKTGRKITPLTALSEFGCFRLGARIYNLKRQGHDIDSQMVSVNGKRVAEYSLNARKKLHTALLS